MAVVAQFAAVLPPPLLPVLDGRAAWRAREQVDREAMLFVQAALRSAAPSLGLAGDWQGQVCLSPAAPAIAVQPSHTKLHAWASAAGEIRAENGARCQFLDAVHREQHD
jgi:hypothetical protein